MKQSTEDALIAVGVLAGLGALFVGAAKLEDKLDREIPGRAAARREEFERQINRRRADMLDEMADAEAGRVFADWTRVKRLRTEARELRWRS